MATFTEDFTGSDHANLGNGWSDDSGFGGSAPIVKILSNRGSSDNNTAIHRAIKAHGITVSGDWQFDIDMYGPLNSGVGGFGLGLLSTSTFNGYGLFVGNAVHIQKVTAGTPSNLTNVSRPGDGGGGRLQSHVTFTRRTSDGFMEVFLDGVSWASATDTAFATGNTCFITCQDTSSPTNESWMDALVLKDSITGPPAAGKAPPAFVPLMFRRAIGRR